MKFLVPFLLALPLALAPPAGAEETVTVRLVVDLGTEGGVNLAACDVTVPQESSVADVLDQAVLDGCIDEWTGVEYPGYGRFVDSIDHVRTASILTYWQILVDGEPAAQGVDALGAHDGDTLGFVYAEAASTTVLWLLGPFLP